MSTEIKKFQIRYNNVSKTEDERWRLIADGEEMLVSDIIINGHTYTTKDWMDDIQDYKWHISCEGFVEVKNNIAYVTTVKEDSVMTRHILKTLSYRLIASLTTVIIAYSFGLSIELSTLIGFGEIIVKPAIYFIHERVWYNFIRIGKR
jgi:adenylylsulfate kinase